MGRRSSFSMSAVDHDQGSQGQQEVIVPQVDNSRVVFLHSEVTEQVVSLVIAQMLQLANAGTAPIHLVVSTYGGSADEMFSLYDTIKFLPCPVHTVGLGKVMSAGVLLLAAGTKGKRIIGPSTRIMMHSLSGGVMGNVFAMESEVAECRRQHDLAVSLLARETKMTKKQIEETIMRPKLDHYVTAQRAIELGIVDKIMGDRT